MQLFVWDATSENMRHIYVISTANAIAVAVGYAPARKTSTSFLISYLEPQRRGIVAISPSGYEVWPEKYPARACWYRVVPHLGSDV